MSLDWQAFEAVHGPVARYRQLASFVVSAVTEGKLKPGDPLPTELQLADYTGLSVDTVRQALKLLRDQDVIVTSQGIGSFVKLLLGCLVLVAYVLRYGTLSLDFDSLTLSPFTDLRRI